MERESYTSKIVSEYIELALRENRLTQANVENELNRSHGYVSERVSGKKPWNLHELDIIAHLLKLKDALDLIAKASILEDPRSSADDSQSPLERSLARHARQQDFEQVAYRAPRENEEYYD